MTNVRAIHTVEYNHNAAMVPTGVVDGDGRIRLASKTETYKPGTVFEIQDAAVVRRLLEADAIEVLDAGWDDVIDAAAQVLQNERTGPPTLVSNTEEKWPKPVYSNERERSFRSSPEDFF